MVLLVGGTVVLRDGFGGLFPALAAAPGGREGPAAAVIDSTTTSTTTAITTTTTTATTTPTTVAEPQTPPPHAERYIVPATEAEPFAKQLAVDIAYWLTTYEVDDDHIERLRALNPLTGVDALAHASQEISRSGSWSRGEVVYPQLGGLRNDRVSVMVVIRQTIGSGSTVESSLVRTFDVRLVKGEDGWMFDHLSSAGGSFENVGDLALAHAVANDPRIEMPDTARLDILAGLVSPTLLELMSEIADQTPYGVVVLATGHPLHVFETDRLSHHTLGRAVDIYRVGDRLVIDDRTPDSETRALVEWLYQHRNVRQVGSPWDIDGRSNSRSFTDAVHQDHLHIAVNDAP